MTPTKIFKNTIHQTFGIVLGVVGVVAHQNGIAPFILVVVLGAIASVVLDEVIG